MIISRSFAGDKEKISNVLEGYEAISPRSIALFVTRTLNYLCSDCGSVWEGYLGSNHQLGFGARQLCHRCYQMPGISTVISRAQAKSLYAMKESELPSVVGQLHCSMIIKILFCFTPKMYFKDTCKFFLMQFIFAL